MIYQKNIVQYYFLALIFIVYTFSFQTATGGNVLTNIAIAAFIALELLVRRFEVEVKYNKVFLIMLGGFVALSCLSILYSVYPSATMTRSNTLILNYLFFFVICDHLNTAGRIESCLKAIAWSGGVATLYMLFHADINMGDRITNLIGNANTAAIYLAFSAICAIYYIFKSIGKYRVFYSILYLLLFYGILLTGSRTGLMLITLGSVTVYGYFNLRGKLTVKKLIKIVMAVAILIVLLIVVYHVVMTNDLIYSIVGVRIESLVDILTTGGKNTTENSTQERLEMKRLAFHYFTQSPIWGIGLGGIGYYIREQITGYYTFCHDNYMELLSGLGVLGAMLYYGIHITLLKRFSRFRKIADAEGLDDCKNDRAFLCIVLIGCILLSHGFIVHYYYKTEFMLLGILVGASRDQYRE
ncbi:O-antigen ligase family protein [Bariatricus sp. HCP28S3_A7]|uniref:O-antigen ligase family protein n=1 Tax=Bariatricus sp. HCP28S3_A7 TaxID=3438894 RepID=UPI003F8AC20F